MLYLKSLTLDRFKSFKHAELLLNKGFTCVVGPNGSGKSNICDALLFGLGETSIHRLRAKTLENLIDTGMKRRPNEVLKSHVKIEFGGDENVVVIRTVRSDGKTEFRLNGKHMTRQEVMEVLNRHKIRADETNTIAQGEINKIIDLNPKERRELIDTASGISEFEYKKDESMKELEKVSQRINETKMLLGERMGYLKELEKDKEAADNYLRMSTKLKSLRYSVLLSRKESLAASLDRYTKEMAIADSKKNAIGTRLIELVAKINALSEERQSITKELSGSTAAIGEINIRLEAINKELARIDADSSNSANMLTELSKTIGDATSELEKIDATVKVNREAIQSTVNGVMELEKQAGSAIVVAADDSENVIDNINSTIKSLESRSSDLNMKISKTRESVSTNSIEIGEQEKEKARYEQLLAGRVHSTAEAKKQVKELEAITQETAVDLKNGQLNLSTLNKEIGLLEEKLLELKGQRSSIQAREGNIVEKIKDRFNDSDGFYGRAGQLCAYDQKYAYAVEAAAGNRLEYLVVDSIDTADEIISYLKKNDLGRATFIPIKEVRVTEESAKEQGIEAVIDVIQCDRKFKKVFNYIFNNSYIVEDIQQAKEYGVGKHRYATLAGDLVEQSGIVSGGSTKKRVSLSFVETQIKNLDLQKINLAGEREKLESRLFDLRKKAAESQMRMESTQRELMTFESEINDYKNAISMIEEKSRNFRAKLDKSKKELAEKEGEMADVEKRLASSKNELRNFYTKAIEASKELAKHGMSKAEKERVERVRKELEQLKIKSAELNKENELLGSRKKDVEAQLAERKGSVKRVNSAVKEMEKKRAELLKAKVEVEKEIRESSQSNKNAYERSTAIDADMSKLGEEKGRLDANASEAERIFTDLRVNQNQAQTRLNDIAAELVAYGQGTEQVKGKIEEMEKEITIFTAKVAELGNVNLKAPEIYDEKKKSVEEAVARSNTLEVERQAVLRMIEEIDSKKLQIFMNTFNDVNKNFTRLYGYIFPGKATIELTDPKDPFNSGLEIKIMDQKSQKVLGAMSGGQKSLISLMLLFAIHLCKPSAVYVFDEVDSALDKENSKKLSQLIKEMSKDAQFIVVSHNDSLIVNADAAIGVVMTPEQSKVVGLDISNTIKSNR
jgi:chromosome segregation protein